MSKRLIPPPDKREAGVIYDMGYPGVDYALYDAIEVRGVRFERVRECEMELEYEGYPVSDWRCSACGKVSNTPHVYERCPRCGARVFDANRKKGEKA